MIKIKDLPLLDRPIERLINKGVESLSNEELIAIILRTGTKEKSAKDLAAQLISKYSSVKELSNVSFEQLSSVSGIGRSKAAILMSCFELSKRINMSVDSLIDIKANNPDVIFEYYKNLLKDKLLFIGTINYSVVHPREVFKEAYLAGASSIILVHNHPTGNIFPSSNDIDTTKKLKEIGDIMGIKVVDHIIIGKDKYYSFYQNKDL